MSSRDDCFTSRQIAATLASIVVALGPHATAEQAITAVAVAFQVTPPWPEREPILVAPPRK
jgi:hypothetical protein